MTRTLRTMTNAIELLNNQTQNFNEMINKTLANVTGKLWHLSGGVKPGVVVTLVMLYHLNCSATCAAIPP